MLRIFLVITLISFTFSKLYSQDKKKNIGGGILNIFEMRFQIDF